MSSILKALKKAEEQSPKLDVPSDVLKKMDTREVVSRRAKHSRTHHRVVLTAVVLIVVGIGTWFVLFSKEPVQILQRNGEEVRPVAPVKEVSPTTVALPATPAPETMREKGAEPRRVKEPPAVIPDPGSAARKEMEPPKPVRQAALPPPRFKEAQESNPDASKYKLEAIVWSENEPSRFAVINGQILRSGGSIGGLSVLSVGKDYVSVRSNGRDWELRFIMD